MLSLARTKPRGQLSAYITSSFAGGIVTGQATPWGTGIAPNSYIQYSMVDPSGTTHQLESDASNPNMYRAVDGSGYTFLPAVPSNPSNPPAGGYAYNIHSDYNGLEYFDSTYLSEWLENASDRATWSTGGGLRLGTLYSPTGLTYTSQIVPTPTGVTDTPYYTLRALQSTVTDPSRQNSITRVPWYWSGYYASASATVNAYSDIQNFLNSNYPSGPYYQDSVGRTIPDIVTMQSLNAGTSLNSPLLWTVPGPEGATVTYQIQYAPLGNIASWSPPGPTGSVETAPPGAILTPDPSTDVQVSGSAIESVTLPNYTEWQFAYYQSARSQQLSPDDTTLLTGELDSPGDLKTVTTPSNGTITYTYTSIPGTASLALGRCNAVCHAVGSRTETDGSQPGLGHSWTTTYSYTTPLPSNLPSVCDGTHAFTTKETDPSGNDTLHSFCAVGIASAITPVANQYHEVETQYYQGPMSNNKLLKTVTTTQFDYQTDITPWETSGNTGNPGIVNFLPVTTTTTTVGLSTTEQMSYSSDSTDSTGNPQSPTALFQATKIACASYICNPLTAMGTNVNGQQQPIPISYLSPVEESLYSGVPVVPASGNPPLRTTTTTYMFQPPSLSSCQSPNPAYNYQYMIALPQSAQVSGSGPSGGASSSSATTCYRYDETGSPQGAYGNQTSKNEIYTGLSGSLTGGTSITTHVVYNNNAMPVSRIDGNGNTTTITYDSTTNLFPSAVQHPATTTGTQSFPHVDHYSYDPNTGNINTHTDENGQTTSYGYDSMGRVTSIVYPDVMGSTHGGSTFCYTDMGGTCPEAPNNQSVPYSLYTSTTTGATTLPVTTMHSYDGWGRQYKSEILSDPQGPTTIDTTYDFDGKVATVSNPYRSVGDTTYGITRYTYDALGRKTVQTQPDNKIQQWCYDGTGAVTIAGETGSCPGLLYSIGFTAAHFTDLWDETGRHTQQVFDALGNLGTVMEADPSSGGLALETNYTYDVFSNLLNVNQSGVIRSFAYDMPSRVTWACNPEALSHGQNCSSGLWGTQYSYDANSNLLTKTDNRNITTKYSYDALNRLLSKTYLNDSSGTASSCYQYDGATSNLSGRLVAQWTQKITSAGSACPSSPPQTGNVVQTETAISGYDPMGRLTNEQRCVGVGHCASNSGSYPMSFTYDLTGKLLTYPSGYGGLSFTNNYDQVGRLSYIYQGTQAANPLFWAPTYTPAGALSGATLNSPAAINMNRTYDVRQRLTTETDAP